MDPRRTPRYRRRPHECFASSWSGRCVHSCSRRCDTAQNRGAGIGGLVSLPVSSRSSLVIRRNSTTRTWRRTMQKFTIMLLVLRLNQLMQTSIHLRVLNILSPRRVPRSVLFPGNESTMPDRPNSWCQIQACQGNFAGALCQVN